MNDELYDELYEVMREEEAELQEWMDDVRQASIYGNRIKE